MQRNLNMAAFIIRHGVQRSREISTNFLQACRPLATKSKNLPQERTETSSRIESFQQSLSTKGFLRSQKPYTPPSDVQAKLDKIFKSTFQEKTTLYTKLQDANLRFQVFASCFKEFQHSIPNSMLHKIETIGDVVEFYETPVRVTTPLDAMRSVELPQNLHIQFEYHRFHPETDTMFNGISAFPKSSTIVTGLKYKKKYPGYKAKTSWP